MHAKNIVHRDIKPANIMLDYKDNVKDCMKLEFRSALVDFGFATILPDGARCAQRYGTPLYMAPEVLAGAMYDSQADIWSFGVTLFELLTGKVPFDGNSSREIMNEHVQSTISFPKSDSISYLCMDFISHCLVYS